MRDLANHLNFRRGVSPAAATTDNTAYVSQIIDTFGYEGLVFLIILGSLADADATFAATMTHGNANDLSDGVAVDATDVTGTLALAGFDFSADNALRKIGYVGDKRYVRLTVTPANNTGNVFLAIAAVLGYPRFAPTPNPPA